MRFGSVCSGIEAASVAWEPLGWQAAWFAEIEPFPSAVLAHHYPATPNLGDMSRLPEAIRAGTVEAPDLLCGGTPCQAFSVAGLRRSLDDARGNLTLTFVEIADAIDAVRLGRGQDRAIIFWENVPGVLNTPDNAFGCFVGALAGEDCALQPSGRRWSDAGCVLGPTRAVAWRILDAQYFGLAQRRRRVFVVASAREGFSPAEVLFESEGVRRDSAPSREAGQDVTGGVAGSLRARGVRSHTELDGHGAYIPITLEARAEVQCVAHSLRGEGFDASEDGTGRGVPIVPAVLAFDTTQITSPSNYSSPQSGDPCHPLAAGAHAPAVAFVQNQRDEVRVMEVAGALAAEPGMKQQTYVAQEPVAFEPRKMSRLGSSQGQASVAIGFHAVAIQGTVIGRSEHAGPQGSGADASGAMFTLTKTDVHAVAIGLAAQPVGVFQDSEFGVQQYDSAGTLRAGRIPEHQMVMQPVALLTAMQVRRLTPRECERLQGFPDGWTQIPWKGKPADQCPDGPRYKALGNSWAVPVVRWIGRRIAAAVDAKAATV